MKDCSLLISFALIFLLMDAVMALSPPQPGCAFYGNVTVNGAPAEDGLKVTAVINGASVNWTAATKNGTFLLIVPYDNADTPEKDGGINGDTVGFYFNNTNTGRTANFVTTGAIKVDLPIGTSQPLYTLTVNVVGDGVVGKSPVQASYLNGTAVTLTASAYQNWTFSGWSGDVSGTVNPINVSITGDRTVTATFVQQDSAASPFLWYAVVAVVLVGVGTAATVLAYKKGYRLKRDVDTSSHARKK
jgi:uncharacterized repeat protein (TIGR02543 family)